MDKKIVIFGAGNTGLRALKKYGKDAIAFWVDNNSEKHGKKLEGIIIYAFDNILSELRNYHIIIACKAYKTIEKQLIDNNLIDYEIYESKSYFDFPEVVFNPYDNLIKEDISWVRDEINRQVMEMPDDMMFDHVEIETINRCNGVCSFCPVNRNVDSREFKKMDKSVFEKIINELSDINYSGKIALFSNNEPLLDDRIIEFHEYTRKRLPNARMHLCTNGTLLTIDIFEKLMLYLDELIIDNYNQELKLIPKAKKIVEYCEINPELKSRVTISLRKPDEILTNRGGDAPNYEKIDGDEGEGNTSCLLPYKQLIIRPDGKVSLCCNDALGKCTMGDVTTEKITEIWFGEKFQAVRDSLKMGRKNYSRCKNCDTVFLD